jgi:hypothetical protein
LKRAEKNKSGSSNSLASTYGSLPSFFRPYQRKHTILAFARVVRDQRGVYTPVSYGHWDWHQYDKFVKQSLMDMCHYCSADVQSKLMGSTHKGAWLWQSWFLQPWCCFCSRSWRCGFGSRWH